MHQRVSSVTVEGTPPEDRRLLVAQQLLDMATEVRRFSAELMEVNRYWSMVAEWALVGVAADLLHSLDGSHPDWQDGRWVVCPKKEAP